MLSRFFAADFDNLCEGGFCRGFFFVLVGSASGEFSSPPKDSLYGERERKEREKFNGYTHKINYSNVITASTPTIMIAMYVTVYTGHFHYYSPTQNFLIAYTTYQYTIRWKFPTN